MRRIKVIILIQVIFFCFHEVAMCQSNFMKAYYYSHKYQNYTSFLNSFPYDEYLKSVRFTDFKTIHKDRAFLHRIYKDGDLFIYTLGEQFIKLYPVTGSNLIAKIKIGESYLKPKKLFSKKANTIYEIVGYYILGRVAVKIEDEISQEKFDLELQSNQNILERLENNKIFIAKEESTIQKITNRGYNYVLKRAWEKVSEFFGQIANIFKELFDKKRLSTSLKVIKPDFQQIELRSFLPIKKGLDKGVRIYKLTDGKKSIGHSIWLSRPNLSVKYYANGNVFNKFKATPKVILATTGGFTNTFKQPEGLTVEKGTIVNAVMMRDRHGLVLVNNNGMNVINLKNESFRLPGSKIIINPLNSLLAYSELLNWCRYSNATIFQTQLLAFSDTLLISTDKAKSQLRERRLLTLVSDNKTREVHHIIFNITESYNLAVITQEVYKIVKSRNKKVEAILNLDVGTYDILKVFDDKGTELSTIKGTQKISKATNLIIYQK